MKQKASRHDSDAEIIKRLNDRFKAEGMFYDRSIFDKGESAKVILNATSKGKSSDDQQV
jgi:hypothetical protein